LPVVGVNKIGSHSNSSLYHHRRNDSHGSGTDSQDNEGKHDYERDPRAWPNYPVPPHPGTTNTHTQFGFFFSHH
jgi:hypothetical protein